MGRIALIPLAATMAMLVAPMPARAQAPTGTITGLVRDASGAAVAGADITITSQQTGIERRLVSAEDGRYAAALLVPGTYLVSGRAALLRSSSVTAIVLAGLTAAVDVILVPESLTDAATVRASATPRGDHHQVGGWVDRTQVEQHPLNGRNVFDLVKVEPGITSPVRLSGGRVFVAPLGAGLQTIPRVGFTRLTLDGVNIETPGTVGTLLQVSPDAVDQLHVSTVNFDSSIGLATSGAVNVVTRSGGDSFRGGAYLFYRDRRWSSSPALQAGPRAADPPFRRLQAGGTFGGPLKTGRAFFFAAYERHEQRDAIVVAPIEPALQGLGGSFESPYSGDLINGRIDVRVTERHHLFVRYTQDSNLAPAVPPDGAMVLPSGWSRRAVDARQSMASVTSVLAPTVMHDLRLSSYATDSSTHPVSLGTCPAPCFGFGAPRLILSDGASGALTLGTSSTGSLAGHRFQLSDAVVWQKGSHLIRFGLDWERTAYSQYALDNDPAEITLWTPDAVRARAPSLALPASFTSLEDLLQLPVRSFRTSIGSGDIPQPGFQPERTVQMFRAHAGDQWSLGARVTVNAGVAWSYEPRVLNYDLRKPAWLAPLVGADGLVVPDAHANLSGTVGLAWRVGDSGRTVVRGGAGRYADSIARTVTLNLATERVLLSPAGTGRVVVSGSNLIWEGRRLNFPVPTTYSGADLLAALPAIRASIAQSLNPSNRDFTTVNLDKTREGRSLYDPSYATPHAWHASVGLERQVNDTLTVGADVIWKRFDHTFINGIDYNRFFSAQGPVIPACTAAQWTDTSAICSNGSLSFDTTSGRARYGGVLVRADQRLKGGGRILASYAYGSFVGSNGTGTATSENPNGRVFGFNNDDWYENYGPLPTDLRHVLNVSGFVVAPWRVNVSFNLSAYGRAPFSAYVADVDFNGDGTRNDLLPGTRVNQFNRGLTRADLVRLVDRYNQDYAGRLTPTGQPMPFVTLPATYEFYDNFFALDLRVARTFPLGRATAVSVFVDVFNVFDTKNLTGFSGNLASSRTFGQPTGRVGQAFGSGGPRAAQFGVRVGF